MKHGLNDSTVEKIQSVLAAFPQVDKAVLYGSRAKGNFRTGSDIDLTLVGRDLSFRILSQIDAALDGLLLPYEIDLSLFSDLQHPALLEHIQRVGVVFYERTTAPTHS